MNRRDFSVRLTVRAIALHVHALFPFLLFFKGYITGQIFIGWIRYVRDYLSYKRADEELNSGFPLRWHTTFPILTERFDSAGDVSRHYFWQDLWAARKVYDSKVPVHYDIGSRLDGFVSHCLPFCNVILFDIRPLKTIVKNLGFIQVDCMNMSTVKDDTVSSISSLHAIEHFGLGRYGDRIDPLGFKRVAVEIQRITSKGADVYIGVPIGQERLEFNAHRVFDPSTIVRLFDQCDLVEFSMVDDENNFHENVEPAFAQKLRYGCGLFHFRSVKT